MELRAKGDWQARWKKLLGKIERVETESALEKRLEQLCQPQQPHILAFINAHAMNCAASSEVFADALLDADTIFRDGSGMAKLFQMLGQAPGLNLNGTDLIPRLIQRFNGQAIALLGTQEPYLGEAKETILQSLAPQSLIDTMDGFQPENAYLQFVQQKNPALIVLGMGMPKQELIAKQLSKVYDKPCLVVCGGAIIDFLGGKVKRAPAWMRSLGIEWLYRLLLEPKRLFQRYVIGNPLFLMRSRSISQSLTST